jgi:hypothetical protein
LLFLLLATNQGKRHAICKCLKLYASFAAGGGSRARGGGFSPILVRRYG